ncbi:MAG: ABC transporter permease [Firmicutes bacterium]|nr:ABC transporter permease [Bacillota bacterium]
MAARLLSYAQVLTSTRQHLILVLVSSLLAIMAAVPLGIMISRPQFRKAGFLIENVINVAQTIPSLAILALFMTILGLGFNTAIFALWCYSLLPILRNTFAGIKNVPEGAIQAAKGMGMTPWHILRRIELPLAYPIVMAGIRTAVVINVGTATLATFISAGGLGELIVTGISVGRDSLIIAGALLSAIMAILFDHILGQVEAVLTGNN